VRGTPTLVAAPTASGKTEAAFAPLYQRHVTFGRKQISILYIAPTKALVNDMYERLSAYFTSSASDVVQRYTGDHHGFKDGQGAAVLVSTPEALDSLLLMRAKELTGIRAVVVDELHFLHGTPRGEHLRYLMDRLQAAADAVPHAHKDTFQRIGMTATIADAAAVAKLWLGPAAEVVTNGSPRQIQIDVARIRQAVASGGATEAARAIGSWIQRAGTRKALVFVNTRNIGHTLSVALSAELAGTAWPVHFHMGLFTRAERDRVEEAMRKERFGVCVATSTLEIGIDIGDINVVILAEPPHTVSAFLQRIGRGNRRSDVCRVVCLAENDEKEELYRAIHASAEAGRLDDVREHPRPSVRFQQVLALAWRGVRRERPLTRRNIRRRTGGHDHADLVNDMIETGALQEVGSALILSDAWMDEGDQRRIHSVIVGDAVGAALDARTGEPAITALAPGSAGSTVFVGGQLRPISRGSDGTVYVDDTPARGQRLPLAKFPTGRGRRGLSRAVVWGIAERRGENPAQWHWSGNRLITWGGTDYNRLLTAVLESAGAGHGIAFDDFALVGIQQKDTFRIENVRGAAERLQAAGISADVAESFVQPSRYLRDLSPQLQRQEAIAAVPWLGFFAWLQLCSLRSH
jgi:ATP-dependent Lhr-like helicase